MPAENLQEQLVKYLEDVHSTEENAIAQLRAGADSAEDEALASAFKDHLAETEEHERLVSERLHAHGASPSSLKDVAQKGTAKMTGMMAKAAPDTSGKLAIEAFSFEHLEIASYRMLREVAQRAGDQETVAVAERILAQEEAAAQRLGSLLEAVAERDLERQGVAA
jgi:ferritin-like metal-binding protein YciE